MKRIYFVSHLFNISMKLLQFGFVFRYFSGIMQMLKLPCLIKSVL